MDKQTVRQVVLKQMEGTSGMDQTTIKDDMNLENDCGLDSLDRVELVFELEKKLNITLDKDATDDAIYQIETVGEFIKFIESKVEQQLRRKE